MGVSATLASSQAQSRGDAGWTVLNKGLWGLYGAFMGTCDADHCGLQNVRDDPESSSQSQLPVLQWVYTKVIYKDSHKGYRISGKSDWTRKVS